jgi:hypothetical protein
MAMKGHSKEKETPSAGSKEALEYNDGGAYSGAYEGKENGHMLAVANGDDL